MSQAETFNPRVLVEILDRLEASKDDPERFFGYREDPVGFAEQVLGVPRWREEEPDTPGLIPEQVELLEAVARGERRIAVKSCHGMGKSFVLAILVLWWVYTRRSLVVTTASTWEQVENVLWREIGTLFRKARVPLPAMKGHPLKTELAVTEDWLALGVSTNNETAVMGKHHRDLLVVIDEAPGVDPDMHRALRSLATGERNVLVMVGNPTVTSGPYYNAFRKGSWCRLHFDGYNHPNIRLGREVIPGAISPQFVQDELEEWGSEDHPMFLIRVRGLFPEAGVLSLYPVAWVDRAMAEGRHEREVAAVPDTAPVVMALDPARAGENRCVVAIKQGGVLVKIEDWYHPDTTHSVGMMVRLAAEWLPESVLVDEPGMGGPILDQMNEQGLPVLAFNTQRAAGDKRRFFNKRAEVAWTFRKLLEADSVALPDDERLREDLLSMQYRLTPSGQIRVETKEEMKARGVKSPDFGDAVVMVFSDDALESHAEVVSDTPQGYRLDRDTTLILNRQPGTVGDVAGMGGLY